MASGTGPRNIGGKRTKVDRKVPAGWFDYCPYGSPIESTRIIPVKTPLKESFNNGRRRIGEVMTNYRSGVPIEEEFTPTQLVRKLESDGLVLGMVVDFTNTERYYDPMEFEMLGVKYMKIKCRGQEVPDDTIYQRLSEVITKFLQNVDNQEKLIAIHCTHGLNRTGYLVCRYIMEHCGYSADKAIRAFNQARGHDMEKYMEHLRKGSFPTSSFHPSSHRSPRESARRPGSGDLPALMAKVTVKEEEGGSLRVPRTVAPPEPATKKGRKKVVT